MDFAMHYKMFDKFIFGFRTGGQFESFIYNLKNLKPLNNSIIKKVIYLHKKNKFFLNKKLCYNN